MIRKFMWWIPNQLPAARRRLHWKAMELEEKGLAFEEIVQQLEAFRDEMNTYFVLNNLETLRKNGPPYRREGPGGFHT